MRSHLSGSLRRVSHCPCHFKEFHSILILNTLFNKRRRRHSHKMFVKINGKKYICLTWVCLLFENENVKKKVRFANSSEACVLRAVRLKDCKVRYDIKHVDDGVDIYLIRGFTCKLFEWNSQYNGFDRCPYLYLFFWGNFLMDPTIHP